MSLLRAEATLASPVARRPRRLRAWWVRGLAATGHLLADTAHRSADVAASVCLLLLLGPAFGLRGAWALAHEGRLFDGETCVGRHRRPFLRRRFAGPAVGRELPALLHVLRGQMSFAGPRPLTPDEAARIPPAGLVRFAVRPGLVSRHALRRRLGIAYDSEVAEDRRHYYEQTLRSDLGLLARAIPASLLGGGATEPSPPSLDLLGVRIANTTMDEALDWLVERAAQPGDRTTQIAFVNPGCLNVACENHRYRQSLARMDRVLPDGIGLLIASRLLRTPLVANVNGTDLFPRLRERFARAGHSLYLLGARPGVAAAAAAKAQERFPGLRIAGVRDGYFAADEQDRVIEEINSSGASALLVALGVPKQELWLARHRDRLRIPLQMGVGGLFDLYSERIPRAPQGWRELGLEWAWRLRQEPGRLWRRYLVGNWIFLYRVWKQARSGRPAARPNEGAA